MLPPTLGPPTPAFVPTWTGPEERTGDPSFTGFDGRLPRASPRFTFGLLLAGSNESRMAFPMAFATGFDGAVATRATAAWTGFRVGAGRFGVRALRRARDMGASG
jgi:hypothetical protein